MNQQQIDGFHLVCLRLYLMRLQISPARIFEDDGPVFKLFAGRVNRFFQAAIANPVTLQKLLDLIQEEA